MSISQVGGDIRWRMHLGAPPDAVFAALDSDEGRASFWAESAVETKGGIEFRFANGYVWRGKLLVRRPPRLWSIDYFGTPATFTLEPDSEGGTELLLTHEGVSAEDWHEVHAGWLNVLFPLKAMVDHGVDLRNHDATRTWEQGYADQ